METTYPPAPAVPVRGRRGWFWQIPACPCCGRRHQHGGGDFTGDPRRLLGHRVAHCTLRQRLGESRGYELVEAVEQAA
jgi:hypothetical protein